MPKDPAFLFYPTDFLVGTYTMSDAQVGQYIRLMCLQHQKGRLPESTVEKIMGGVIDPEVVAKFVKDEDGMYYNVRLEEEVEKRAKYTQSRRNNRAKAQPVASYDNHMSNISSSCDNHMSNICETYDEHMENENVNGSISITKTPVKPEKQIPPALEDVDAYCAERKNGINASHFMDFYSARGWMIGKTRMKDWRAAIRTWEQNSQRGAEPVKQSERKINILSD